MSKKSRRAKGKRHAKSAKARYSQQPKPVIGVSGSQPLAKARYSQQPQSTLPVSESRLSARVPREPQDIAEHYRYVIPDLRRIGITAGSMILVIIVLLFFLG